MQLYRADSGSDSEPASPSHDPIWESAAAEAGAAAARAAASPSAPAVAAGPAVEREDWMTKSFPKAAANTDAVPLPGAKPVDKKVCCRLKSLSLIPLSAMPFSVCYLTSATLKGPGTCSPNASCSAVLFLPADVQMG